MQILAFVCFAVSVTAALVLYFILLAMTSRVEDKVDKLYSDLLGDKKSPGETETTNKTKQ